MKWHKSIRVPRWKLDLVKRALLSDSFRRVPSAPLQPQPDSWSENQVTLAWLGHSTVLINFFGITVLTDPVLGSRIGVRAGPFVLGPKRLVKAALRVKELPPIDVIVLSHSHFDHLDLHTLKQLRNCPVVVTAEHSADLLRRARFKEVRELPWGSDVSVLQERGGLRIEAFKTKHWGARFGVDWHRGWNGYVLERKGKKLIFGGDTANSSEFQQLRGKGPFDLAMMPIGGYDPWIHAHCTPEQAVAMADAAGARFILPIHHCTFRLSKEPLSEPITRFTRALSNTIERVALQRVGETFVLPD